MMSLRQWFRWRTLRAEGQTSRQKGLEIQWWPLIRLGKYPRWGIWVVRYENPPMKVYRCRWCGRRVWFHNPDKCKERP